MDNINLIGTEEVRKAGGDMYEAARIMFRASSTINVSLSDFLQKFESLVERFETACNEASEE